jgi:integrase
MVALRVLHAWGGRRRRVVRRGLDRECPHCGGSPSALATRRTHHPRALGQAYGTCPECGGAHVLVDEVGQPYRPPWYSDRFVVVGKAIGLTRVPLHGSRHCAASLLADLGIPEVAITAWLGHTKVEVTRRYTHAFAERLAETSRVLGDALAGE